jgi:shikimate kinase
MAESNSFKVLKDQYFLLDRNFNKLFLACQTDEQRNQLRTAYVNSRDNFWEARNRVFQENDPLVRKLITDLKAAQKEIEQSLQNLKDIVKILQVITAAVHLGSSLITLGSAML